MAGSKLEQRVDQAAEMAFEAQRYVSAIDVLLRLGWLTPSHVERWRQGSIDSLDDAIQTNPTKVAAALAALQRWAQERNLKPSETDYVSQTRDRRVLRFSGDGDDATERIYRTHWVSPDLDERAVKRQSKPPELLAIMPIKDWTCTSCEGTGDYLFMEDAGPVCLDCADFGHLEFLPAGDAALTRRAKKASGLSAVVVRWSRSRKRYERQGILAEVEAIQRAEQECLSDADARARRRERDAVRRADEDLRFQAELAAAILVQFPHCPADRAERIARHAAIRGSGRVGRSAAGRALDPDAVHLAVAASIRHEDTDYDELLMSGVDRQSARDRVYDRIETVLDSWRSGSSRHQ
ncbi:hypothetical protein A5733_14810 [Mycobacterium sp. NS-7484]|uniref:DUF2293 domain-containing protein n=1 Tax=Mycobacterium sp. NS-7484 TaxID=1834161 RepID=UPI00096C4A0D|nr:DUF2293 domain-containing protein [Mycobacterium sp. NS-7484]OMB94430.1 hypothetical protein A5733_14810 [Mycobacterium sp. NS-7484]